MTALVLASMSLAFATTPDPIVSESTTKTVDLVICIDTSGSMTALIDSARGRLWDIVNTVVSAAPEAELRVGLLTYGSPSGSTAERGWVVRQTDLTTDLDTVYAKMMSLSTSGGDEYVGWVLNDAVNSMSWAQGDSAVGLIFVAGNESADQAREHYDFRSIGMQAQEKGLVISALYAGAKVQGSTEQWGDVARHGGGSFASIDMQRGTRQVATPYDQRLEQLNSQLNSTYIPYGSGGSSGYANMVDQDNNARRMGGGSSSSRIGVKSSKAYQADGWDLVDDLEAGNVDLDEVSEEELPADLRSLDKEKRRAKVEARAAERSRVKTEIQALQADRQQFLDNVEPEPGPDEMGLDEAMQEVLLMHL